MNARRSLIRGMAALTAGGAMPWALQNAIAQAIQKTARVVIGFPPGGAGDATSRSFADKARGIYAPTIVVENKPGAGGRIAAEFVKNSEPDGATIFQTPASMMTLYPHVYRKLPYDPQRDFAPVTTTTTFHFSMTAGPGLPASVKSVQDYVAWVKADPARGNYGSPSAGSALHFLGQMLARATGLSLTHIAYKGGAPLMQDLLAGQVPVAFNVVGENLPHIAAGKLRSLGTAGAARNPFLPDVPTLAEQGFTDLVAEEVVAFFVPARTPADVIAKLQAAVRDAIQSPDVAPVLDKYGLKPRVESTAATEKILRDAYERWGGIVKATGFTPEE